MTSIVPPWYKQIADIAKASSVLSDEEKTNLSDILDSPILMELNLRKPEHIEKFQKVLSNELAQLIHKRERFWSTLGKIEKNTNLSTEEKETLKELSDVLLLWGVAHR